MAHTPHFLIPRDYAPEPIFMCGVSYFVVLAIFMAELMLRFPLLSLMSSVRDAVGWIVGDQHGEKVASHEIKDEKEEWTDHDEEEEAELDEEDLYDDGRIDDNRSTRATAHGASADPTAQTLHFLTRETKKAIVDEVDTAHKALAKAYDAREHADDDTDDSEKDEHQSDRDGPRSSMQMLGAPSSGSMRERRKEKREKIAKTLEKEFEQMQLGLIGGIHKSRSGQQAFYAVENLRDNGSVASSGSDCFSSEHDSNSLAGMSLNDSLPSLDDVNSLPDQDKAPPKQIGFRAGKEASKNTSAGLPATSPTAKNSMGGGGGSSSSTAAHPQSPGERISQPGASTGKVSKQPPLFYREPGRSRAKSAGDEASLLGDEAGPTTLSGTTARSAHTTPKGPGRTVGFFPTKRGPHISSASFSASPSSASEESISDHIGRPVSPESRKQPVVNQFQFRPSGLLDAVPPPSELLDGPFLPAAGAKVLGSGPAAIVTAAGEKPASSSTTTAGEKIETSASQGAPASAKMDTSTPSVGTEKPQTPAAGGKINIGFGAKKVPQKGTSIGTSSMPGSSGSRGGTAGASSSGTAPAPGASSSSASGASSSASSSSIGYRATTTSQTTSSSELPNFATPENSAASPALQRIARNARRSPPAKTVSSPSRVRMFEQQHDNKEKVNDEEFFASRVENSQTPTGEGKLWAQRVENKWEVESDSE
ncbi:unnamed protein product [Amoebophrya sp. A25]|nr:unnamed protein product [Amoebophrya sp. A25]|eukprot:GSA25T00001535001.1